MVEQMILTEKMLEHEYWWVFGGKGGVTRALIINILRNRPFNAYQLSKILKKSYNNIKYHLNILRKSELIANDSHKYSSFYFLTKNFNDKLYQKILDQMKVNSRTKSDSSDGEMVLHAIKKRKRRWSHFNRSY